MTTAKTLYLNRIHEIRELLGGAESAESLPLLWQEMLCFLTAAQLGEYVEHVEQMMPELGPDGEES